MVCCGTMNTLLRCARASQALCPSARGVRAYERLRVQKVKGLTHESVTVVYMLGWNAQKEQTHDTYAVSHLTKARYGNKQTVFYAAIYTAPCTQSCDA